MGVLTSHLSLLFVFVVGFPLPLAATEVGVEETFSVARVVLPCSVVVLLVTGLLLCTSSICGELSFTGEEFTESL